MPRMQALFLGLSVLLVSQVALIARDPKEVEALKQEIAELPLELELEGHPISGSACGMQKTRVKPNSWST